MTEQDIKLIIECLEAELETLEDDGDSIFEARIVQIEDLIEKLNVQLTALGD